MHFSSAVAALAAALPLTSAVYQGFNYGSTNTDGSAKDQARFEGEFNAAKKLAGAGSFTSARLYTMIQGGTGVNGIPAAPISAIPAAGNTGTSLLLGMWASAGQDSFNTEVRMLQQAITQYGLNSSNVAGISVGSEDLYRQSPTGIINKSGIGENPDVIVSYINQVRQAIGGGALASVPVGHVDTWTAWVNGSNNAVSAACDFVGMDAYPYFQNTQANGIENGKSLFDSAYQQTIAAVGGKPVWITETGWPVSGPTENQAVPNTANAKTYWDQVGCGELFGKVNTFWFTLQDAYPTTPSPSFGVIGLDITSQPLYDLTCPAGTVSSASPSQSSAANAASSIASSRSLSTAQPSSVSSGSQAASIPTPIPSAGYASSASSVPASSAVAASSSAAAPASSAAKSSTASSAAGGVVTLTITYTTTTCPVSYATSMSGSVTVTSPVTLTTKTVMATGTTVVPASSATMATSKASSAAAACPTNLNGEYQYPHLIVPVNSAQPSKAYGTSYNVQVNSTVSDLLNFDIPASYAGKTCSLVFLFPTQAQLTTSSYTISGAGGLSVKELTSAVTEQTTYATIPKVGATFPELQNVKPGSAYVVATNQCGAGQRIAFEVSATGSLALNFFQDYNPSPIGFYITTC